MVVSAWRHDNGDYPLAILLFFTKIVYGLMSDLLDVSNLQEECTINVTFGALETLLLCLNWVYAHVCPI
jgi:hypothetical protein